MINQMNKEEEKNEHLFKISFFFFHKIKLFTDDDKLLQHRLLFTLVECGTIYCIHSIHEKKMFGKNRNETVLSFCGRR
jgi:hypothetical protein